MQQKLIDEYKAHELVALYKSYLTYKVTDWILYTAKKKGEGYVREQFLFDTEHEPYYKNILCGLDEMKLEAKNYKNEKEKEFLKNEIAVLRILREARFYCGGFVQKRHDEFVEAITKDYEQRRDTGREQICDIEKVEDMWHEIHGVKYDERYKEIHMNDEEDRAAGRATRYEILEFIWYTLRFCDARELKRFLKFAENNYEFCKAHRPRFNKKVYKYDLKWNLLATYESRDECIEKEKKKKNALSMVLSGERKQHKGFRYKEE